MVMLPKYLRKIGRSFEPVRKNSSHSGLGVILNELCGRPQFNGSESFLWFGNYVHELWLLGKVSAKLARKLTKEQKELAKLMVAALIAHPVCASLYKNSKREIKRKIRLNGVLMAFILDIHKVKERIGVDLKTTSARNMADFIKKAKELGYFRQAQTYMLAAKLKEFYFIGITKEPQPQIFILNVADHKEEMEYALHELQWLLYMFKMYGKLTKDIKRK
jgi:hypothetical protein